MTRGWTGLVLSCLTLMTYGATGMRCFAKPQEQREGAAGVNKREDPNLKPESSNLEADPPSRSTDHENSLGIHLLTNIARDQETMWTSPARIRLEDATWLVPLGGLTAGLLATDRDASLHLSNNPTTLKHYNNLSNYGLASMVGGTGALYLWGHITHDDLQRETGLLAGEAALNSLGVTYALKYTFGRERPQQDNFNGKFWKGGDSFPSEHAAAAWSIASVITHEYPGPLPKLLAFGAASAVSFARVRGKQHFPSDMLVGTGIGWLSGWQVYTSHHDPELGGTTWSSPAERFFSDRPYQPKNMGSPSVPLDSWIYPALDRLAALGYVSSDMKGMRPWTRMECARLVEEAADHLADDPRDAGGAHGLYDALEKEFSREIDRLSGGENREIRLESVYARATEISGQPLRDGYDFGQTIINDYGRPYAEGLNSIEGFSGWASDGPFFGYLRGEYQSAPSAPALPDSARQVIQNVEQLPTEPPDTRIPAVSQFDPLEAYAGMQLENWQITFGKQAQWWGPGAGGAMLFSTNAEPINMLRINTSSPFNLPSFLGYSIPVRVEFLLGRLAGQHWVYSVNSGFTGSWTQPLSDQPFISGGKVSFKLSPNLEMGVSATAILAGSGMPFTTRALLRAFFSFQTGPPGSSTFPGDRRGEFDFTYRIPKLRNWLTWYADAYTDDEVNPWIAWDKAAFTGGLYMPRIPKIPQLDLRVEGVFTDLPGGTAIVRDGFFYFNDRYRNGYTNNGNLIGSWIGRDGQGAQAWTTYWFSPKNKLQLYFRHQKVSWQFIPDGGTLTDAGVRGDYWVHSILGLSASVQYERWLFPVIQAGPERNVTASIEIQFQPQKIFRPSFHHVTQTTSEAGDQN